MSSIARYKLPLFLCSLGFFFLVWVVQLFSSTDSFISVKNEDPNITIDKEWEEYLKDLERRNNLKLKASYEELMKSGKDFAKRKNFHDAAACYYFAKSIYPEREEPRRFLSEAYINLCSHHGQYCGAAKKEIYFAFRYVRDTSLFYSDLLDMATAMDLHPYLDLQENDALPIFFDEKEINFF